MSALAPFALCLAAFALLALAMDRHHAQVLGHAPPSTARRRLLRTAACALLVAAGGLCLRAHGTGVGLVTWCALLNVAGLAVGWLLAYQPRWLLTLTVSTGLMSLLSCITSAS